MKRTGNVFFCCGVEHLCGGDGLAKCAQVTLAQHGVAEVVEGHSLGLARHVVSSCQHVATFVHNGQAGGLAVDQNLQPLMAGGADHDAREGACP